MESHWGGLKDDFLVTGEGENTKTTLNREGGLFDTWLFSARPFSDSQGRGLGKKRTEFRKNESKAKKGKNAARGNQGCAAKKKEKDAKIMGKRRTTITYRPSKNVSNRTRKPRPRTKPLGNWWSRNPKKRKKAPC